MKTYDKNPDYNVFSDEEEWDSLIDHPTHYWDGVDWIENDHVTYSFDGDNWKPLNYEVNSDRTFAEISLGSGGYGTTYGYRPIVLVAGELGSVIKDPALPFTRYFRLYRGDGLVRWRWPKLRGRKYMRFYMQSNAGTWGYNRKLFVFRNREGDEIVSLGYYASGSESESPENRLLLMKDGVPISEGLRWVGTSEGSLTPGAWNDLAYWYRVEIMIDPGYGFVIKVYDEYDSDVPSDSNTWSVSDTDLNNIDTLEIREEANTFPELRDYTRIASIGLSNRAWPGHIDPGKYVRSAFNGVNTSLVSTSCPFSSPNIPAGRYSLASVLFFDNHDNNTVPNIVPPPGFQRLGFTYVGNAGGNVRGFLFLFGRHYDEADTSSKSFSVTGGRTGNWILNERQYVNVNPDNPIATEWDHTPNTARGTGGTLYLKSPDIGPTTKGDAGIMMSLTKNDTSTLTVLNTVSHPSPDGAIYHVGTENNSSQSGVLRRNHLNGADISLESSPSIGGMIFQANRVDVPSTSAIGRLVLRSQANPSVGEFTEYPVPATIPDP